MASAFSQDAGFLIFIRFVCAIGLGAEITIIAPYLIEFVPAKARGRFAATSSSFQAGRHILAAGVGYFIIPASPDGWRIMPALTAAPIGLLLC